MSDDKTEDDSAHRPLTDAEFPDPPDEDEIDARLAGHKVRLLAARQKQKSLENRGDLDPETARGMGFGLTAAYTLIGLPLVGTGLGWLADRAAGTNFFTLIGAVAGLAGGIAFAIHVTNRQ